MKELMKINPKMKVDPKNVDHLVNKGEKTWIYLKTGYPKIKKAWGNIDVIICKLANSGLTTKQLNEIIGKSTL